MITLDDRRNVYRAARSMAFPRLRISGHETVMAGEPAWRVFCQHSEDRQVAYAAAALALARPAGAEAAGGGDAA